MRGPFKPSVKSVASSLDRTSKRDPNSKKAALMGGLSRNHIPQ
jgi:hypothetical protein